MPKVQDIKVGERFIFIDTYSRASPFGDTKDFCIKIEKLTGPIKGRSVIYNSRIAEDRVILIENYGELDIPVVRIDSEGNLVEEPDIKEYFDKVRILNAPKKNGMQTPIVDFNTVPF